MSLALIALIAAAVLVSGYLLYGRFIARQYRLDDAAVTPAARINDGEDFIPTRPFYLMGQHFSAIAAAGPIVGPIAACQNFGWLPCLLWILIGVVFIGAVHDFSALIASVRHGAHSIAEIARRHLGPRAWIALVGFIYLALLYIIVAFTDVTARTFVGVSEDLGGAQGVFNKGGAVAASSTLYLLLALTMGVTQRLWRGMPMWLATLIFVPATLGCVWAGTRLDEVLLLDARTWQVVILAYCFVASLLPMWLLQQPRGFLGGFVLYLAIAVGLVGVLFGGFSVQQPAVKEHADLGAWLAGGQGAPPLTMILFPFIFVTIACGACSGFHGLICGGTTSKQIAKESHCKPIGFGAMLLEGLVAVIALGTIMILTAEQSAGKAPSVLYGDGLAAFITRLFDPSATDPAQSALFIFAATFGAMAFSTFVFDTLDVTTRLGRYLLCELTGLRSRAAGVVAAALTAGIPLVILFSAPAEIKLGERTVPAYMIFWTLFGTANQLLAALTLLAITVWLKRQGKRYAYTLWPMLFVAGVTLTALVLQVIAGARRVAQGAAWHEPAVINAGVAVALMALALVFAVEAIRTIRGVGK